MDWIEKLTGLELDGGTGALEWLLVLAPLAVVCGIAYLVWRKRAPR
ncbi:MAG TPA: hypothetical protein PLH94_08570 [Fimbriimonadaceae bacterium]|nr:hypothetical protein [Fimbriimonadaceae bacterium]